MNELLSRPAVKAVLALAGLFIFLWLVYASRTVLFPFVVAFGLAYLFDPLIDRLEAKGVGRSTAIFILLTVLFIFVFAAAVFIGPIIWGQVDAMAENIPHYIALVKEKIKPMIESMPDMDREKIEGALQEGMRRMGDIPLKVLKGASQALWTGLSSVMGVMLALFNLVIIPVATFYLLKDFDIITEKITVRVPPRSRDRFVGFFKKIDTVLNAFFRGQFTVALVMALILATGLFFIGSPMGVLIGLLAGLSNIVPYLPIVVGLLPALILTYLQFTDLLHPLLVLLLFGGAQAFEGLILTPRILEKAVGLHPVAIMAALLIGGHFFGFLGVLLAVPAAAALKVALYELDEAYLKSDFFNEDGDS